MRSTLRSLGILTFVLAATPAFAQTIDLAAGGADPIWRGIQTRARAGESLDQGAVSSGDSRRDLVIGAPGDSTIAGTVYIVFGGPIRTGSLPLSTADAILHGGATGDRFGYATATGNILTAEGSNPKTLVVGAPGSLGTRGIVYVFAGGFRNGDVLTTADAVAQIVGNTGDQLGTSLATADLNNDGYREVIVGAPGSGRIYVIAGGPALGGTIDLSLTPAAVTFTYPGLGLNLSAGDITGDGIYDLLVGHPAANAVHVLRGRNGAMPPAAFDMSFGGIDTADGVGRSVRLADVDADGRSDIIVGAPDADGPGDARYSAGEVYLIWGGPMVTGRSLALADVTFVGATAGERMGAQITAGDINRDTPNDLVFLASDARGGAGALHLYYGRSRGAIGVLRGDGTRLVDFATQSPSRSILGDTGGGSVTASLVFEVTGEGARDVIVGMSGNGGYTGAVYFTISPRLTLGSSAVPLVGYQGIVTSSPVPVRNISEIPITWLTSSNRPWLSATPTGSTSAAAFGDVVITANADGLAPGTYTGTVTVTSTSVHLTMSQAIAVSFEVRETQPTPASAPVAGVPPGARHKLLWRHASDGWLAFWHMDGLTLTGTSSVSINRMADANWRIAGMGDLNGDGHRDIVWQHETSGALAAWFLNGSRVTLTGYLSITHMTDPNWKIRGVGDTDGDGRADLLWQNDADGRLAVWYMNGAQVTFTKYLSIPRMTTPNWHIRAVGDTDGDGRADILWHKSDTGELAVWFLQGYVVTGTRRLSVATMTDVNWAIAGSEDVNGDGRADILWQHATGTIATWYLDGATVTTMIKFNPSLATSTAWRVAGPK